MLRFLITLNFILILCVCAGFIEMDTNGNNSNNNKTSSDTEIKIYKRLIPADVLRDFSGMCFASTRCATVEPGKTWDLTPFCGRSTCVQDEKNLTKLLELVEDCGPLPLANDRCKLDTDKTNKTASFPYCCPTFICEPGIKLEYPDILNEDTNIKPSLKNQQ